jgi:hypothetical protein
MEVLFRNLCDGTEEAHEKPSNRIADISAEFQQRTSRIEILESYLYTSVIGSLAYS